MVVHYPAPVIDSFNTVCTMFSPERGKYAVIKSGFVQPLMRIAICWGIAIPCTDNGHKQLLNSVL